MVEDMHLPVGSAMSFDWDDESFNIEGKSRDLVIYNFELLMQEGFINAPDSQGMTTFVIRGLTWRGHEFLDSVRNPEVWTRTKAGMNKVGGIGIDLALQLAKAEGKRLITERLGVFLP